MAGSHNEATGPASMLQVMEKRNKHADRRLGHSAEAFRVGLDLATGCILYSSV